MYPNWGRNERFALVSGRYCGKTMHIRAGTFCLYSYMNKDEAITVHTGYLKLEIGPTPAALDHIELLPGDMVHISQHGLGAIEIATVGDPRW
jgi:mannose-6-phosphate isomerase